MKRKIVYVLSFSTILILLIILLVPKKEETFNVESKAIKKENIISIMLETDEGSQEYTSSSSNTWPTDGYKFNKERSGCENGSILSWDNTTKSVIMSGDLSDKCYVYFDKFDLVCPESFNITKQIDYSNTIPAFFASELNYSITKNYNIDKLIITKTTGEIIEVPYDIETNMFSSFEDSIGASGEVGIQKIGVGTLSFINGSSCNIEFTLTINSSSNEL